MIIILKIIQMNINFSFILLIFPSSEDLNYIISAYLSPMYLSLCVCVLKKTWWQDFSGSSGGKNPPANAGDTGSSSGLGRSRMPRSNCAHTLEPASHNYWAHAPRARALQQEKPPQWAARTPQWRVAPSHPN